MDQLFTTFGIDTKLLLIQVVNFGVLFGALSYILYRPLMNLLDERTRVIETGVRNAAAAEEELRSAADKGKRVVADASKQAEEIVANARVRADERAAEIVTSAETKAEALARDAQMRANEAARRTIAESEKEIARAAILAAEKILKNK